MEVHSVLMAVNTWSLWKYKNIHKMYAVLPLFSTLLWKYTLNVNQT